MHWRVVRIGMTFRASGLQTEISPVRIFVQPRREIRIADCRPIVTLRTGKRGMFSCTEEPCRGMIEAGRIEFHCPRRTAEMLLVALDALPGLHGSVVPEIRLSLYGNLTMAFEAFIAADGFTDLVTFGAIRRTLKLRVGAGKLSRRELCRRACAQECRKDTDARAP